MELPSKVLHKKFLRVPDTKKVVESDEEWSRCGKWNLFNRSRDVAWFDGAWVALQSLVKDGYLLMLKASTAANKAEDGVIICYTRPEKEVIRRAAEEIRKKVDYGHSMYYKDNGLTEKGVGKQRGHMNFSLYLHTPKGQFYRKNGYESWELEEDNQAASHSKSSIIFDKIMSYSNLDVNHLPSCAKWTKLDIRSKNSFPSSCIFTYCNLSQDESGLSEADRLWLVARKLLQDNVFSRIECIKTYEISHAKEIQLPSVAKSAKIQIYIPRTENISSLVQTREVSLVQTICKMTKYTGFFYGVNSGCRYSFDGEVECIPLFEEIEIDV